MSTITQMRDAQVFLSDVDWETYQKLRAADGSRNVRMTYDEGSLELMSPSKLHERVAELLGQFVVAWTEEQGISRQSCGSMTFQRQDLKKGFEPDKCYYLQNESAVRGRDELDLTIDPPPDLAIEVDVSAGSSARMPLYAAIGLPEVWRWRDGSLQVFRLTDAGYQTHDDSTGLPGFPIGEAERLLAQRHTMDDNRLVSEFRAAIRAS